MSTDIRTDWVSLTVNDGEPAMDVLICAPPTAERQGACLICPEIFGLTDDIRAAATRVARLGLVVAVPDFHHRTAPRAIFAQNDAGRAAGLALLHRLNRAEVVADLFAAKTHVEKDVEDTGVAILGFSAGGHIAYLGATAMDFRLTISLYGGWIGNTDIPLSQPEPTVALTPQMAGRGTTFLYIVGSEDHLIPRDEREQITAALIAANVKHEIVVYDGVKHGFMFEGRPSFDAAARKDAWRRIEDALRAAFRL